MQPQTHEHKKYKHTETPSISGMTEPFSELKVKKHKLLKCWLKKTPYHSSVKAEILLFLIIIYTAVLGARVWLVSRLWERYHNEIIWNSKKGIPEYKPNKLHF